MRVEEEDEEGMRREKWNAWRAASEMVLPISGWDNGRNATIINEKNG